MDIHLSKIETENIKKWLGTGSINLFGRPFAGKDTQGEFLASLLHGPVIGGGDILRRSNIPSHVKEHVDDGKLSPTKDYLSIVLPFLSKNEFKGKPLILSAVGRWHGEEESVMQAAEQAGHPIKAVILLDLPETQVWQRWHLAQHMKDRGPRADDDHHKIQLRLDEYKNKTLPVIEHYRELGLLIKVDGTRDPKIVTRDIIDKLEQLVAARQPI